MGGEGLTALYGTRGWAGKRATLERTLSTPSNCAFPPKISHPKGFRSTILESHTALSGTRGWEGKRTESRRESWVKGRRESGMKDRREGRVKGRRESAVGSFGDGCRGAQRALRHEGLGGKARHTGTDGLYAVPPRFPSEGQSSQRVPQHYSGESYRAFLPRANHINSSEAPPTPSNRAFPLKVSHPKGFRDTILDSPTTVSLRRSNEQIREHRTAAGIYDCRLLKTAPASLTGARRRCLCGTGTEKEERQKNKPGSHVKMTAWFMSFSF